MHIKFVQNEFSETDEWKQVSLVADKLIEYLNQPDISSKIMEVNQPRASSGMVQNILLKKATELGFKDESEGLFAGYTNKRLRPDYFKQLTGNTGILIEVERGKTNHNNMDFLDFWKCHICQHAHYLFLFVPDKLKQNENGRVTRPYLTVVSHIESFFVPDNYTNVRGVTIIGY
jgi:hypothetical protein